MNAMIEAQGISFSYGSHTVLDDISFDVNEGEFVALTGSNGAGKSTLLRLLLGEISPSAGMVRIMGQDVSRFRDWPRIGYVPQNGQLTGFPATAGEIVVSSLYKEIGPLRPVRRSHREKARHALALVGMESYENRLIGQMSGGQQQRVFLARVLAANPSLMLLDEPTTGMDAASAVSFYALLSKLNRELGLSILMVTHDSLRISQYVTRAFCLEDGSMVALTPQQLAHERAHRHQHPHKEDPNT